MKTKITTLFPKRCLLPSMSSLCCDKHRGLKGLGQERVCFAYVWPLQSTRDVRAGTETKGNHGGTLLTGSLFHDLFNLFFYTTQATSPGMPPPTVGWAFPHQTLTKKNVSTDLPIAQSGRAIFSTEAPLPRRL